MARFRNYNYAGGLNRTDSDFTRKNEETKRSVNVGYDTLGNIKKRLGYEQKGGIFTSTSTTSTSTSTSTTTTSTSTSTSTSTTTS